MGPVAAFVGLGANLGDARATVLAALAELDCLPGTRLVRSSSLYVTEAIGASGPSYINAVAEVATALDPLALLGELQSMENAAGRTRPYPNAPRTLDLDLLLHGQCQLDTPRLTLPHPRMYERAFVLVPLAEIAKSLVPQQAIDSVANQSIQQLPV